MKKAAKFLMKTVKWTFIVFCVFLGSLFFREQRIPADWIVSAVSSHVPSNIVFKCDSASFGFRRGARMRGVRLYDRERMDPVKAVVSADSASVDFFLRRVRIVGLKIPRLHDGYYLPGNIERNGRLDVEIPDVPSFSLTLIRPDVLGIAPERVVATVKTKPRRVEFADVRVSWPDIDRAMSVNGSVYIDLDEQRFRAEARGEARQSHIRPLLVTLDVPVSVEYMDAFTGVTEPIPVSAKWDVNLVNNDFRMLLDLHPQLGRYNDVPMRRVDGELGLSVFTRGTNLTCVTTVGPLSALDPKGRPLDGRLVVTVTNDVTKLDFDVKSGIELKDLLSIADCLNDGTLDCVSCETPPEITVTGTLMPDFARQAENNLHGTVAFKKGVFFESPVEDVAFSYSYVGDTISFDNISLRGKEGGRYTGKAKLHVPASDPDSASFSMVFSCSDGSLGEIAEALGGDFGGRHGVVNSEVEVTGPISTNLYSHINGCGKVRVTEGRLAQMKLFMGLTDYLAANVPGVASLVNQSQASVDYTITNGVFASDNIFIEGAVFSIKASGTYDIPADKLDFTVRLQLLKNDSFLGKLVHPVMFPFTKLMFPFTKLLLEFKVTGSAEDPKWDYISVLDRIL